MKHEFNEIIKDNDIRERVIKYFKLPMRYDISAERFLYVLSTIDLMGNYDAQEIRRLVEHDYVNEMIKRGSDDFSMEHIFDDIIDNTLKSKEWKAFIDKSEPFVLPKELVDFGTTTSVAKFYSDDYTNKFFLSIDLRQANWQTYCKIMGITESYADFINKYTDNLIPSRSKTFRTKITGLLDARSIGAHNQKLLNDNRALIADELSKATNGLIDLTGELPVAFYADEIIYELDETQFGHLKHSLDCDSLESVILDKTGIDIHLEAFVLHNTGVERTFARILKDRIELKMLSPELTVAFLKANRGLTLNEEDLQLKLKTTSPEELESVIFSAWGDIYNIQQFIWL